MYHGRIILPPTYPLRPPSFRFLTPTGRFEVNREICLSISGHHEETWQPAWGIRTAIVAIRSFMDTDAKGQLGGIECNAQARKRMAVESGAFKCSVCGKTNAEIIRERGEAAELAEAKQGKMQEEVVPDELRLAYRDELDKPEPSAKPAVKAESSTSSVESSTSSSGAASSTPGRNIHPTTSRTTPSSAPRMVQAVPAPAIRHSPDSSMTWIDIGIYGVVAALLFMVLRKFL